MQERTWSEKSGLCFQRLMWEGSLFWRTAWGTKDEGALCRWVTGEEGCADSWHCWDLWCSQGTGFTWQVPPWTQGLDCFFQVSVLCFLQSTFKLKDFYFPGVTSSSPAWPAVEREAPSISWGMITAYFRCFPLLSSASCNSFARWKWKNSMLIFMMKSTSF